MKSLLLLIAISLTSCLHNYSFEKKTPLLSSPSLFKKNDMTNYINSQNFAMNWIGFGHGKVALSFFFENDKTHYTISVAKDVQNKLISHKKFTCKKDTCQICFEKCYDINLSSSKKPEKTTHEFDPSYYFSEPLVIKNQKAKKTTIEQLAIIMKEEKHVFYSGAGLSYGYVPTMVELNNSLQINKFKQDEISQFVEKNIANAEKSRSIMHKFYKSMLYKSPTKAHWALKDLAQKQKVQIITENLDLLQHRTGIKPIGPPSPYNFKKNYDISGIKYLICLGLSHDDRGLIAWLRTIIPELVIIAIDLKQPNYLSKKDFLLRQDLQTALPILDKILLTPLTHF